MQYFILSGSQRRSSQSIKVSRHIQSEIQRTWADAATYLLDLGETKLPFWDEDLEQSQPNWSSLWEPIKKELESCDSFIVVTPEWSGMVPAAVKNFFLLSGGGSLAHKPALIVSVSAGRGGAYPVAELRMSSYKNHRLCYIPDHVIVRDCESVLNSGPPASESDKYLRERLVYTLKVLSEYAKTFKVIRSSGVVDFKKYPNGM